MIRDAQNVCQVCRLGRMDCRSAWQLQEGLVQARARNVIPDTLLLLEHPPTYTLGCSGNEGNLLVSRRILEGQGAAVLRSSRGGDVTYHGPGQLVGYPVLSLRGRAGGVGRYLRDLEEVLIGALSQFGVAAERMPGFTGVWAGDEKIAAIGIKLSAHGITCHGFALNIDTDLKAFDRIMPCGIADKGVTSLTKVLGYSPCRKVVADRVIAAFETVFNRSARVVNADCIGISAEKIIDSTIAKRESKLGVFSCTETAA